MYYDNNRYRLFLEIEERKEFENESKECHEKVCGYAGGFDLGSKSVKIAVSVCTAICRNKKIGIVKIRCVDR